MRVRLTADSPVKVGGREQQVSKLEYAVLDGSLHVVSPRKLGKLLLSDSEHTLDEWNAEVLREGQEANLTDFLHRRGLLSPEHIRPASLYSVPTGHDRLSQFQPHARDAHARLFIPGTAIKGAIRVAVTWAQVDEEKANAYVPNEMDKAANQNRRPSKKWFGRDLDKKKMQGYELPRRDIRQGPHHDLMRAFKVSDAYDGQLESRVESVLVQSYSESQRGRTATLKETIHVECLVPGSWVEFDLKVDEKIIRDFQSRIGDGDPPLPFTDASSLLELVRSFYEEVWSFERQYYGDDADKERESAPSQQSEEFLSQKAWITKKYGPLSRDERSKYKEEYMMAREKFEAKRKQERKPERSTNVPAIQDGREIRLQEIREFYSGECPGFRLGWGSGLMSTTVDMRLDEENMGKVLNLINSKHPRNKPIEGPKSRRLVGRGRDPRCPMGWANLEMMG